MLDDQLYLIHIIQVEAPVLGQGHIDKEGPVGVGHTAGGQVFVLGTRREGGIVGHGLDRTG